MKVCILMPMYNEEAIAQESLETTYSYIKKLPPLVHLLVVNDGSSDATESLVSNLIDKLNTDVVKLISNQINLGYGGALKTGIQYTIDYNYDYALFMDSDMTNHPKYLEDFYQKMLEGWDYIKATRYSKGGSVDGVPLKHYLISRSGNIFAKMVTGIPLTDITNGFRAVKVNLLKDIEFNENGFNIIVEEVMKVSKKTKSICEIPNILGTRNNIARPSEFGRTPVTFWRYFKCLFIY